MKYLLTAFLLIVILVFDGQNLKLSLTDSAYKPLMEYTSEKGLMIYDTIGTIKYLLEKNRDLKKERDSLQQELYLLKYHDRNLIW